MSLGDGVLSQEYTSGDFIFSQIPAAPKSLISQVSTFHDGIFSQVPKQDFELKLNEFNTDVEVPSSKFHELTPLTHSIHGINTKRPLSNIPIQPVRHPSQKRLLFKPPLKNLPKRRKFDSSALDDDIDEDDINDGTENDFHQTLSKVQSTPADLLLHKKNPYTPSPLILRQGTRQGVQLKAVTELPEKFSCLFDFPFFNIVQTKVFNDVFYSDKPLVLCAPTGAGKTVVFELAIVRLIMKLETLQANTKKNFKIVYMAPIKALCSERFLDWQQKFTRYGLTCQELTGDSEIDDYNELQDVNIIFTTPEKWDSMTRKWRDNKFLVQSVCLFLVDEIHMLNDNTRGATIEAVISRMKTIQQALARSNTESLLPMLRFVAVSATIPNIIDIAEWLGDDNSPATYFNLDESYRPVRLRKVVLGFPYHEDKGSEFKFDFSLNYKLAGIVNTYAESKPTLVFCTTRKSTQQASEILAKDAQRDYIKSPRQRQLLSTHGNMVKDHKLRDLVLKGIAYHHAGLDLQDRKIIEELFCHGTLLVLFATSTLAMGVNLPAHLVIVKSTVHYNMGVHVAYSDSEVLQMIGRAGRPQFDTSATAVIMTKNQDKHRYESLVNGAQMIESSLHRNLIEHLNAEIVLHTINDISIAMEWIRHTFLYIRVMKNPRHYGMPLNCDKDQIERKLQEMCMKCLNQLASLQLITLDEDSIDVKPTEAGRLMARYCIAYETMKRLCGVTGTESISDLLTVISNSEEFSDIQLRISEKKILNGLNCDKNRPTISLIQAALGCLLVQDFSLQQETNRIFRVGQRIARCLVEVLLMKRYHKVLVSAVQLGKCLKARLWEDSKYVAKQLEGIGPAMSNALVNAGIDSFQKIEEKNPRELELIVNRHPPFGNQLKDSVVHLPKYELTIDQVAKYSEVRAEIIIHLSVANMEQIQKTCTTSRHHMCLLIIGDADNNVVFKRKLMDLHLKREGSFTKKIELTRARQGPDLSIDFISQDWVGIDVHCTYTPTYLGGTKVTNSQIRDKTVSHRPIPPLEFQRLRLEEGREECNHRCTNKNICAHDCCKFGVLKRKPVKSLTRTPSMNRAHFMDNYISDLKKKIVPLPVTPRSGAANKPKSALSAMDLTQFAYRPEETVLLHEKERRQDILPQKDSVYRNNEQRCRESWVEIDSFIQNRDRKQSYGEEDHFSPYYSDDDEVQILDDLNDVENYGDFDIQSTQTMFNLGNCTEESREDNTPGPFDQRQSYMPEYSYTTRYNQGQTTPAVRYQGQTTPAAHISEQTTLSVKCQGKTTLYDQLDAQNTEVYNKGQGSFHIHTKNSYPDIEEEIKEIESLPSLNCHRNSLKTHRYGKVVAWNNSQEPPVDDLVISEEEWSGSDNDLITTEYMLPLQNKEPVIQSALDNVRRENGTENSSEKSTSFSDNTRRCSLDINNSPHCHRNFTHQTSITQYGSVVKKIPSKAFYDTPRYQQSETLKEQINPTSKFGFSSCFTDNREMTGNTDKGLSIDTFDSIFDGIF